MLAELGYRFCPRCGTAFEKRRLKEFEPERLVCPRCAFVFYLNPKVAAGAVVEYNGGIVLLRREIDPRAGFWVHPGGFVDRGETLEAAARRETREEVGLEVEIGRLLGAYSFHESDIVVVTFAARAVSGVPMVGDESLEVATFRPDEIPWDELAFPSTRLALAEYVGVDAGRVPSGHEKRDRDWPSAGGVSLRLDPGFRRDDGGGGVPTVSGEVRDQTREKRDREWPTPGAASLRLDTGFRRDDGGGVFRTVTDEVRDETRNGGGDRRAGTASDPKRSGGPGGDGLVGLFHSRAEAFRRKDARAGSLVYPALITELRKFRLYREALKVAEEGLALTHDPLIARLADEVAHELAESEQERC